MAGLPKSSNGNALHQWHQLFKTRGIDRSPVARQHMQQLLRLGLPTRKHENWKYTPLDGLVNNQFVIARQCALRAQRRDELALPVDALRLVFVDGHFNPELSDDTADSGFAINPDHSRRTLPAPVQGEAFLHLTESLAETVMHISVAPNARPKKALLLMHITRGCPGQGMAMAHYRHHLTLGQGAQATVIEHFVSLGAAAHFTGSRFTAEVAASAQLNHYKLAFENPVSYHFAHNDLLVAQDSTVNSNSFLLGAAVLRHNTSTQLNGENSQLHMNSLALPVRHEVFDTRTWLEHNNGFCNSRQRHKTIVCDQGRAVFNGVIAVARHAIKTDGQMTNNNLLLGHHAEVDTRPQLEIYADDVKCSHGATTGRIGDDQLFYLRSRGISEQAAQQMIIFAFAAELTEGIRDEILKQQVLARIARRVAGGEA